MDHFGVRIDDAAALRTQKMEGAGLGDMVPSVGMGGKTGGMLFVRGEKPVTVRGDLAQILLSEIERRFPE